MVTPILEGNGFFSCANRPVHASNLRSSCSKHSTQVQDKRDLESGPRIVFLTALEGTLASTTIRDVITGREYGGLGVFEFANEFAVPVVD